MSLVLLLGIVLGFGAHTQGAQRTWTGAGANFNWNTAANWATGVPVNGDSLLFTGVSGLLSTNNIAGLGLSSLRFDSSAFTLFGNALSITNGILDTAGSNTNNIPLTLGASQSFTNSGLSPLVLIGNITNGASGLTIWADGDVVISGILGNGSGGLLKQGASYLILSNANTFAGGLTISGGVVRLGNAAAIPSGAGRGDLTIGSGTFLELFGFSPTINGLYGDGTVDNNNGTGTYTLTVGASATNSAGTFNGMIQNTLGNVALTKIGTNLLTLNGSSTYSGATRINEGTLKLDAGGVLGGTPSIFVAPGAVFDIASSPVFSLGFNQALTAGRTTNFAADVVGNLTSAGSITVADPLRAGTLTIAGGLTLQSGMLSYNLGTNATAGGGTNDLIVMNGPLNVTGPTAVRVSPLGTGFSSAPYTLMTGLTSASGVANFSTTVPRGVTPSFDATSSPGNLLLRLSGTPSPANLRWSGSFGGAWDVKTTQNWLNGATPDVFVEYDSVTFDDSAVVTAVDVPLALSAGTIVINNSLSNYVFTGAGSPAGVGSLTKSGTGNLTVRNAVGFQYTGPTTINGGLFLCDFNDAAATASQLLYSGLVTNSLVMNGGTFRISSRANTQVLQGFGGTELRPGAVAIDQSARQSSGNLRTVLGSITRSLGAVADLSPQTGNPAANTGIFLANTNVNNTLGGYLTFVGSSWATRNATTFSFNGVNNGQTAAYAHTATDTSATAFDSPTNNVDVRAVNNKPAANRTVNSLRFSTPAITLTLSGSNTIASGGLLVTAGSGSAKITGGTLRGATNADLIVIQRDAGNSFEIASVIEDNGGPTALTKAGAGILALTANNTYTGPSYISEGTLQLGNGGTSGSIVGSLVNNGTFAISRSDALTYGSVLSGRGGLTVSGGGTITLAGDNTYAGLTTIAQNTILSLGNGGPGGSASNSPSIAIGVGGTLVFNRSDTMAYSGVISGGGAVAKQGAGAVILNGANVYGGNTTINQGTLALGASGSVDNTPNIIVQAGAKFDVSAHGGLTLNSLVGQNLTGNGSVIGNLTAVSGTAITPGSSYGSLNFSNNLTLNGGTLIIEISLTNRDTLTVAGNLNMADGLIMLNVLQPLTNGEYPLIIYGTKSGAAANIVVGGFAQAGKLAALSEAIPGVISLKVFDGSAADLVWQGDGTANVWNTSAGNWSLAGSPGFPFSQADAVTFNDSGSATPPVNLAGSLYPSLTVVSNSSKNYTFGGSGSIAGPTPLFKEGSGTLAVLTLNTYAGGTRINGGTVQVGNGVTAGALGPGPVVDNGTLVYSQPANTTVPSPINGTGTFTKQGTNMLSLTGDGTLTGPTTVAGTLQIGNDGFSGSLASSPITLVPAEITPGVSNNGALVVNRRGNVTQNAPVTGAGSLTKVGPGTLTLGGANAYTGDTTISGGALLLGAPEVIPDGASAGNLILNGGAVLDLNNRNETINGLTGTAGTVIRNDGGGGVNTLTIGNNDATSTFNGNINNNSGSGGRVALAKTGAGTLTLDFAGQNLYGGGTIISNGILELQTSTSGSTLGNPQVNDTGLGTGPVTFYGGILQLDGWAGSTSPTYGSFPNPIVVPTNQVGAIRLACRVNQGPNGTVSGAGTLYLAAQYVRCWTFADFSGFTGQIVVTNSGGDGDNLGINNVLGMPNARFFLGDMGQGGSMVFYNRAAGNPIIPIGELAGDTAANINLGPSGGGGASCRWLIGGLNTSSVYQGNLAGALGIIKQGTGTLTFSNNVDLSYSLETTVSNGVLRLAGGTLPNSTPISVAKPGVLDASLTGTLTLGTGQTLQGDGTINGSVLANGPVAPGFPIGTLTVTGDLILAGTVTMELNRTNTPTTSDRLAATTITANGGTLTVTNIGPGLRVGDKFQLFSKPLIGSFGTVSLQTNDLVNSLAYTWSNKSAADGTIEVLTVQSLVNTTPTNLTVQLTGNTLALSWPADHIGWRLLAQTNAVGVGIGTNWFAVPGSALTNRLAMPVDPTNGSVFYRLVYP